MPEETRAITTAIGSAGTLCARVGNHSFSGIFGYLLGHSLLLDSKYDTLARRAAISGGLFVLPLALLTLNLGDGVRTSAWGGVMLNLMLAAVGIALAFPAGVLLALGRASSLPVIRIACTAYIEFVRAGPLILWLAVSRLVLPDFMPAVGGLDDLDRWCARCW